MLYSDLKEQWPVACPDLHEDANEPALIAAANWFSLGFFGVVRVLYCELKSSSGKEMEKTLGNDV